MAALPLDDWHGDWNYTLRPEPPAPPAPAPAAREPERPDWAHPALTGLTAYASAHGIDLTPKAKPAC